MNITDNNITEINNYSLGQSNDLYRKFENGEYSIQQIRCICGDDFDQVCEMLGIEQ